MSDEVNPTLNPTKAAYQLTLEMVKAGSFSSDSKGGDRKAKDLIEFFDLVKKRFEKLKEN